MRKWIFVSTVAVLLAALFYWTWHKQEAKRISPSEEDWKAFEEKLSSPLLKPKPPFELCAPTCKEKLHNPFYLQSIPSGLQSQGWQNAWKLEVNQFAVGAKNANDIQQAVLFAKKHNLKLVIKGAGHDYLGRSNGADALLIWTHKMKDLQTLDSFIPQGAPNETKPTHAISLSAGNIWLEAYEETTTKNHRYVQGGGCTTVGTSGGFLQGGGFGSFSKKFGTAAASALEFEVVTANGELIRANRFQNEDLFWALKGGGGSTFGIVTQVVLETFPLPKFFAVTKGKIQAADSSSYKRLIHKFLEFFIKHLNNEHWGEEFSFSDKNSLEIFMLSQGLSSEEIDLAWAPLIQWVDQYPHLYRTDLTNIMIPPEKMWNTDFWKKTHPELVLINSPDQFWWKTNAGEVFEYWYTYQSWWLSSDLFKDLGKLSDFFFEASRLYPIWVHTNKGQKGASFEAIQKTKETSMHPGVLDAVGLIIMSTGTDSLSPPQNTKVVKKITEAMQIFTQATPDAGSYVNEGNYFQKDWQKAFWGSNYPKLLEIKRKYDPSNLFHCHHSVGSETLSKE